MFSPKSANSTQRGIKSVDEKSLSKKYNFVQFFSKEILEMDNIVVNISESDIKIETSI